MANNRKSNASANSANNGQNSPDQFTTHWFAENAVQTLADAEAKQNKGTAFAVAACAYAVEEELISAATLKAACYGQGEAKTQAKSSVLEKVFEYDLSDSDAAKPSSAQTQALMNAAGMAAFILADYVPGSGLGERILYALNKARGEWLLKVHGNYACTKVDDANRHDMVWIVGTPNSYSLDGIKKNANAWANPESSGATNRDERRKKTYNQLGVKDKTMLVTEDLGEYDPEEKPLKGEVRDNVKALHDVLNAYFGDVEEDTSEGAPDNAEDAFGYAIRFADNPESWKDSPEAVEMAERLYKSLAVALGEGQPQGKAKQAA